jgi:signal transduction histidine kinase
LLLILSLAFFCFAFAFWYIFVSDSGQPGNKKSLSNISVRINEELKSLPAQAGEIKQLIETSERPSFTSVVRPAAYPFFIFRNKGIYIWSDNSFSVSYEALKGDYQFKALQLRNGKHIVFKTAASVRGDLFEIFVFLPLTREYSISNTYVDSGLNPELFNNLPYKINLLEDKGKNIYSYKGEFLFSLEAPGEISYRNDSLMYLLIFLVSLAILFLLIYLFDWVHDLRKKQKTGSAILMLFAGLFLIRGMMLFFNFPFSFYEFDLFNSKFFASSSIAPSLGDFLLNTVFVLIFSWFLLRNYYYTKLFRYILYAKGNVKTFISIVLAALSFFALYCIYEVFGILSYHSQWSLDITSDLEFNVFRIISIFIFISCFVIYFIYSHIFFRIFINQYEGNNKKALLFFIAGTSLHAALTVLLEEFNPGILVINFVYFLILLFLQLPKSIGRVKYATYLYFLSSAFVCSAIAAYALYIRNTDKTVYEKIHYGTEILYKNDVFGEFLLNEAIEKIKSDEFIRSRLKIPLSSRSLIEYKIKRAILPNYFDKYDVSISVFDAEGKAYDKKYDYSSFEAAKEKYTEVKYKTEYPEIFFYSDSESGFSKYLGFINIRQDTIPIGNIIIELKHKKIVPHSVYPELLVDNSVVDKDEKSKYDYAVFSDFRLLYSFGNYNYSEGLKFFKENLDELLNGGIIRNGFHHIGVRGGDNRLVIISSPGYHLKRIFSNFSFYFLILILFTILFVGINAINFRLKSIPATYAAKIQIYLNIAFFLPLLIVSITTLSIISSSYRDSLNHSFIKKAEDISSGINGIIQEEKSIEDEKDRLENHLLQISRYTESDISLYNSKGKLLFSNQPAIFEIGLMSKLINPQAYSSLIESSSGTVMLPERIGKLKYNSVYVPIRSLETGELLAILSMPFFESKKELDRQIIEVLTTIINIFVTIFIFFLFLSYFASNALTVPLRIITQKLKKTDFEKNEPIEWKISDEIGMLVGEYNSMLVKLEESREALSKSEKESAWREMAKQVAHEIKNPLTPMKLTIQHLQRSMYGEGRGDAQTSRTLNVLLEQVNNLNEIATSFSLFAKMPIPKNQRFEIGSVLGRTAALHNNSKEALFETDIQKGDFFVMGDEQLMGAIFTNLILNGIQSVPADRKAKIFIGLKEREKRVLIEIKDNGGGIPEAIREKVFLPNFSTKFSGSGIGLAVAKRGVEHAGGRIWFETLEGKGTSFFIEIPTVE